KNKNKIKIYMSEGYVIDATIMELSSKHENSPSIVSHLDEDEEGIIYMGVVTYFEKTDKSFIDFGCAFLLNNGKYLVILVIVTSEIKVIIGEVIKDSLNIIGVGTAESKGMRKGAIVDIDETVLSIKSAVEQAEHMVGMNIEHVIVAVNGNQVQLHPCHGVVAVQDDNGGSGYDYITRAIDGA